MATSFTVSALRGALPDLDIFSGLPLACNGSSGSLLLALFGLQGSCSLSGGIGGGFPILGHKFGPFIGITTGHRPSNK